VVFEVELVLAVKPGDAVGMSDRGGIVRCIACLFIANRSFSIHDHGPQSRIAAFWLLLLPHPLYERPDEDGDAENHEQADTHDHL
jgi:hypothetical protein